MRKAAATIASRNGDGRDATSKPTAACGEPVVGPEVAGAVGPKQEAAVGPVVPIVPG